MIVIKNSQQPQEPRLSLFSYKLSHIFDLWFNN